MQTRPIERTRPTLPRQRVPLASVQQIPQVLPRTLGTLDLISLFLLNVFWVTNVTPLAGGGAASFTYWLLTGVGFFIPCSLVLTQLARLFPGEGSIYTWTYYALGPGWNFFVGLCAWLPGIVSLVTSAAAVVALLQALQASWLVAPWQQGLAILAVLALTGILSCQRLRMVRHLLNAATVVMGVATLLIGGAAVSWLLSGHPAATTLIAPSGWQVTLGGQGNLALLGSATLALFGSDMPLTLAAEVKTPQAIPRHLTWGTLLTLLGYALFTFALLVVQGAPVALNTVNPLSLLISTVDTVFGKVAGDVMATCLLLYFSLIPVALNICFARFPMLAALDRTISLRFARVNRHGVPVRTLVMQVVLAMSIAILLYVAVPAVTVLGQPADLTNIAYNVLGASLLLVWTVSFLFLFLDLAVLFWRDPQAVRRSCVLPWPLLLLGVCSGTLLCGATMVITLFNSFLPTLIPNTTWWWLVGGLTLAWLVGSGLLSMLTNSEVNWEAMQEEHERLVAQLPQAFEER